MSQKLLATIILFFTLHFANAQLGAMKLVGKDAKDYSLGFGAFIKAAVPVTDGSDVTLELGANFFFSKDGNGDGTAMCPLKAGYRFVLNGTHEGFYIEPQAGYNLYGVTSLTDQYGQVINFKYHGAVLAAGTGYIFYVGNVPIDINLRYETVMAHQGANSFISLGITKSFSFGRRDSNF